MLEDNGAVRPAATVILLRPAVGGGEGAHAEPRAEVLLMRRVPSMGFAPGAFVFPGGRVDERDADGDLPWTGPGPREWAEKLRTDVPMARALVCAAVRETFEETGVLLASEPERAQEKTITPATTTEDWERDRLALIDGTRSFTEVLSERGLVLRSEWLRPWARWITPKGQKRRYDTFFFVAELPSGQSPRDVGGETDLSRWTDPEEAGEEWFAGRMPMLAPTVATCAELAQARTLQGVWGAERDIFPIEPEIREIDGRAHAVLPSGTTLPLPGHGVAQ